jgi:hypothetical protein
LATRCVGIDRHGQAGHWRHLADDCFISHDGFSSD